MSPRIGFALFNVACIVLIGVMFWKGEWYTNVGFLVTGALLSLWGGILADWIKRPHQAADLARGLYVELSDRVARCCYDCEAPWQDYLQDSTPRRTFPSVDIRKFVPEPPVIYPSTAAQISILPGDAPQEVVQFYNRLAAWRRDLVNIADWADNAGVSVRSEQVTLLAVRLFQTLRPGLRALEALAPMVPNHVQIEAQAIGALDRLMRHAEEGSLRERIGRLLQRKLE